MVTVGKLQNFKKLCKNCVKLLNNFEITNNNQGIVMQNDLKFGKISELCGINGYFFGGKMKKSTCMEGGGENSTFSKNILPCKNISLRPLKAYTL